MKKTMPVTPYYVIKEEALAGEYNTLSSNLQKYWGNVVVGYSFKTNSLPWLISFMKERGAYAEVVSHDEYLLAKYMGYKDSEIIYNGPYKDRESFRNILLAGGYLNMDSRYELAWLKELSEEYPDRNFKVGIRVNFDLERMCPGETTMKEESGRFGFCYETGAFADVLQQIQKLSNVKVNGLHLHSSSKSRSVKIFESIAKMAVRLKKEFDLSVEYVDMGGGYCGGIKGRPTYDDYIPAITKVLKNEFRPEETKLIVEPGISLISSAFTFVTKVLDVRDIKGNRYLITDGSRFNVDTTMIKTSYFYHVEYEGDKIRDNMKLQHVTGFTCMEADRLFKIENLPELKVGDRIVYENVGGYTMSLNPLFIQYFPDAYVEKEGHLTLVRKKWGPEQYVQNCCLKAE